MVNLLYRHGPLNPTHHLEFWTFREWICKIHCERNLWLLFLTRNNWINFLWGCVWTYFISGYISKKLHPLKGYRNYPTCGLTWGVCCLSLYYKKHSSQWQSNRSILSNNLNSYITKVYEPSTLHEFNSQIPTWAE